MMDIANHSSRLWGSGKQDTIWRFILLSLGILATWALLINLLQVNFDFSTPIPAPTDVEQTLLPPSPTTANPREMAATKPKTSIISFFESSPHSYIINIQQGDTLQKLFATYGVSAQALETIKNLPQFYNADTTLHPGSKLQLIVTPDHVLQKLIYPLGNNQVLIISRHHKNYVSEIKDGHLLEKVVEKTVPIHGSIYVTAKKAGLSPTLAMNLINIFDPDIDFNKAIHAGDKFTVIYDEDYKHNRPIKAGDILAAQMVIGGKVYQAFRDVDHHGDIAYYTATGKNLQKAFMRAPIHYKFISSPFNLHRMHPILHIVRPHLGVDLAAPAGTPIHASSDGVIHFMGRLGGYGNVVIIRNSSKYSTRFAHMERFAKHLHRGSRVEEGQVIGYVGQTGLATGPHLHYEFRIYGKPVNPMKVKLPQAAPIARAERGGFLIYARDVERDFPQK